MMFRDTIDGMNNIFDTDALLNRPAGVAITNTSGTAGVAHWINAYYELEPTRRVEKSHPGVAKIVEAVTEEYDGGRTTAIADEEMAALVAEHLPEVISGSPHEAG